MSATIIILSIVLIISLICTIYFYNKCNKLIKRNTMLYNEVKNLTSKIDFLTRTKNNTRKKESNTNKSISNNNNQKRGGRYVRRSSIVNEK